MFFARVNARKGMRHGFTLIELLIVVAIIAILAAIAVPNFLEAQTRAKVSRIKADTRSMVVAVEAYVVDYNKLPKTYRVSGTYTRTLINSVFTTPVAYITSVFPDIFNKVDADKANQVLILWGANGGAKGDSGDYNNVFLGQLDAIAGPTANTMFSTNFPGFFNTTTGYRDSSAWLIFSAGPDMKFSILDPTYPSPFVEYDPTNGTISSGDVVRFR